MRTSQLEKHPRSGLWESELFSRENRITFLCKDAAELAPRSLLGPGGGVLSSAGSPGYPGPAQGQQRRATRTPGFLTQNVQSLQVLSREVTGKMDTQWSVWDSHSNW